MTIAWLPCIARCYDDFLGARNDWDFFIKPRDRIYISRANPSLNDAVYRVNTPQGLFGCKIYLADERRRIYREWSTLRILDQHSLPLAPLPIEIDDSLTVVPSPVIVMSWVQGRAFNHQRLTPPMLHELIFALQKVHSIGPRHTTFDLPSAWAQPVSFLSLSQTLTARLQNYLAWQQEASAGPLRVSAQGLLDLRLRRQLETVVAAAASLAAHAAQLPQTLAPVLIRGETVLADVFWTDENQICLVDWDGSGWGDPAYDLAALRWHPQNQVLGARLWDVMRALYVPPPLDDAFSQRLRAWEMLLPCDWCLRSLQSLLDAAQPLRNPGVTPTPESLARNIRLRFDRYLSAAEAMLKTSRT